jgi:hypothetical protein
MSITTTTLSSAVGANDQFITLASVTGVTTPNFQTSAGITYLKIDEEMILVQNVPSAGTTIQVLRGQMGSGSVAHVSGAQVQIGLPSDFPSQQMKGNTIEAVNAIIGGLNMPGVFLAGSADAIPAGVAATYIVKTAGVDAMTLAAPTAAQEGNIIMIISDTTNAHTLTATSLLANGTALKTTATFPAFKGACLVLRVTNLVYTVLSNGASAGVVVLT